MTWMVPPTTASRRRTQLAHEQEGEEEEDMTEYTRDDLQEEWEFKIVRSDSGAFRNPEVLRQLIEEESRAGWVMLEKFDNNRVRFKRSRSARARDAYLPDDVDPYRTQYGAPTAQRATVVALLLGLVFALGGVMAFMWVQGGGEPAEMTVMPGLIFGVIIVLGVVVLLARRSR